MSIIYFHEIEFAGEEQDVWVTNIFEDLNSSDEGIKDVNGNAIDETGFVDIFKELKEDEAIVRPKDYKYKKKKSNHKLIIFDPKNKKIKNKRKRKDMEDNKRKKIKSNFYNKYLNKELNNLLKDLKVQKKFSNLSQVYIAYFKTKIKKGIIF